MAVSRRVNFDRARKAAHRCLGYAWRLYGAAGAVCQPGRSLAALAAYHDTVEGAEELCEQASRFITPELVEELCKISAGDRAREYRLGSVTSATAQGLALKFLAVLWEELQYGRQRPVVNVAGDVSEVEAGFDELERRAEAELHDRGLLETPVMDTKITEDDINALHAQIDREWGSAKAQAMKANSQPGAGAAGGVIAPTNDPNAPKRRGRLSKEESEARRANMLATICQHPSLMRDVPALARMVGVSESTARRWLDEEQQKYLESKAARPEPDEE